MSTRRGALAAALVALALTSGACGLDKGETRSGSLDDRAIDPTSSTSAEATPIRVPVATGEDLVEHSGEGVFYDEQTGQLQREANATVTRLERNPIPTDADRSVAIELQHEGETRWMYLYWSPNEGGAGADPARDGESFDEWLTTLDPDSLQESFAWQTATPAPSKPGRRGSGR